MVSRGEQCFRCLDCGDGASFFFLRFFQFTDQSCTLWSEYKWCYSCGNFIFLFPVWQSEGKPRRILVGFWIKTPLPVDESYNFHPWGKSQHEVRKDYIVVCFLFSSVSGVTRTLIFIRPKQKSLKNLTCIFLMIPGAPLTYFNDGGVRRIFLGLTFWPKGIFWGRENNRGIFLGVVFFISSNQK